MAAMGVFALVAQLVTQRTREIAIRVSLAATAVDVTWLVVAQMLRPVILGAVAGLAGASAVSGLLVSMIATAEMPDLTYGAGAFPPATFAGALGLLLAAVLAASFLRCGVRPASRPPMLYGANS